MAKLKIFKCVWHIGECSSSDLCQKLASPSGNLLLMKIFWFCKFMPVKCVSKSIVGYKA